MCVRVARIADAARNAPGNSVARVAWMPLQPLEGFTVGVTANRRA